MLGAAEWGIVALSLKVGAAALVVTLPIAFALAWLLARRSFPGKVLVDAAVHLPLVVPPVVTGWLLLLLFAPAGPLGALLQQALGISVLFRWTGAAIAAGVMALPLMVRAIRLSIEAVDRRLENAARTLGASPLRVFRTVTIPLSFPGILAAAMLGFARGIGEFGATITFVSNVPGETRTLPLAIYSALQQPGGDALVLRLSAISVALSLAALVASELLARRGARRSMSFEVALEKRLGEARIALSLAAGDGLTILFGPSGAGKTSVLNMVAGLLRPDRGAIRVGGETLFDAAAGIDMPPQRRRAGYVFQDARLFPHLRVRDNLRYAAPGRPLDPGRVAFLGIDHLLDRWPRALSGGEARRVAIGRALLSDPGFLLLDEPLSSLDGARREEVMAAIEHLRDTAKLPMLMVTHDRGEAERLATRIVAMPAGG